ncbi:MAG: Rz1-like lysis system protein LysC [Plesiomonas sp.]|uniref:Rz1-like lysis system protein LysC n=1 Tax=Plesiomonas sp. TaxID=2486279 RepID=UPI003F3236D8
MFTGMSRTVLVFVALLSAIAWLSYENNQQRIEIVNQGQTLGSLEAEKTALTAQRDQAWVTQDLLIYQFNRFNRIAEEARRAKQETRNRAESIRRHVRTSLSAQSCSAVLLPAPDTDRLLNYVSQIRQDALHPNSSRVNRANTPVTASRRLTWGQAVEWIPLLLGDIESCNNDKAALRLINEERANEATKAQ